MYIAVCIWSIATTTSWINRTFPGFLVIRHNYVATLYLSEWSGFQAGIKNVDKILAVNGEPMSDPRELYDFVGRHKPGTILTYTILRGERQQEIPIPVSVFTLRDYVLCFPVAMLVGLFFCGSGLVVFYLKPRSPVSLYILLGFISLAVLNGANGERCTNGVNFLPNIFVPMMGPPVLLFSFYFPVEVKWKRLFSALVISIMLTTVVLYVYGFLTDNGFIFFDRVYLLFMFICLLASAILQAYSYVFTSDQVVRQKAKVAIYGFFLCFLGIVVLYFGAIIPKRNNFFYSSMPAAVIPLTLGYAVVKHNLFDVDVFIRRSVTYLLLSGIVVALFFGFGTALSLGLQEFTGQSSRIATVVSTILIIMLFNPLRTRIDRTIDRRFFRERYEYSATIRKASSILVSIIDLNQLLHQLLDTVTDAIKIERGLIMLKSADREEFKVVATDGHEKSQPLMLLPAAHPFLRHLEDAKKAVQINDVEELHEFEDERALHLEAMAGLGIVLAIPVLYERRLIGLLGLSEKKSGAWYSSEDMELLSTLMMQTAISIENARKVRELKKMIELEASYRELKKIDELKDNFLSMVSHDLRTPMTSIKGYVTLLNAKAGTLSEERQKHYTSIVMNECDRLTRLINDLLDLQRFEAGRMQLDFKDVDLAEITRSAAASFRGAAIAGRIDLREELPPREVMVSADADRLAQVVSNLLSNALKFSPEESTVIVSMEIVSEDGVRSARVWVKDNGPGIPEDQQAKLFDKFQQVEGLVRGREQGSGLGLALVREIVNEHGGEVGVDSEPGRGSAFYFTIKLKESEGDEDA
jgi:signal transduction histidine kinase